MKKIQIKRRNRQSCPRRWHI